MSIQLALTEYCKDNGLMSIQQRNKVSIKHLGAASNGNHMFSIVDRNQSYAKEEHWELEKYNVSRFTLNGLVYDGKNRKPTTNEIVKLVSETIGYQLINSDIGKVTTAPGGWLVDISETSFRFEGTFKVKNKRGK